MSAGSWNKFRAPDQKKGQVINLGSIQVMWPMKVNGASSQEVWARGDVGLNLGKALGINERGWIQDRQ